MSNLPKKIRRKRGLPWGAKVLFAELASMGGDVEATTGHLAKVLGASDQGVRNWLQALEKAGFITQEQTGAVRQISLALFAEPQNNGAPVPELQTLGVVLPWQTIEFSAAWDAWKRYKATQHRFRYKTPETEQRALKRLQKVTDDNETLAIAAIEDSMAQAYQGIHLSSGIRREHAKPKHDDLTEALRQRGHI